MKQAYVLLTGSINNAGDYLIKFRAKKLLSFLRPDRQIIDYDRWKNLTDEQVKVINRSKALILTGGPSLRPDMYPKTFPLVAKLERLTVPILTMGAGWNHSRGSWEDTHHYGFSRQSISLLNRIAEATSYSGVRDYHTLNTVHYQGYNNFMMTGCPALYDLEHINTPVQAPEAIKRISFSLGTRFVHSPAMEESAKSVISGLARRFEKADFTVVFHHSINPADYKDGQTPLLKKQLQMVSWLKKNNIRFVDISGNAHHLMGHYTETDLHIGYRVHAHIFCSSISKPSILIAEDGRGFGLARLNVGIVLPGFHQFRQGQSPVSKAVQRLRGRYVVNGALDKDVLHAIDYEIAMGFPRLLQTRQAIDTLFPVMERYIQQLP